MKGLSGTGALIRLILRRDWWKFLIWIALAALVPIGMAASFKELYPTAREIEIFAATNMNTPSAVGMLGLVFAPTLGGILAWRVGLNAAILIAPVSLLFVIRYTRTEEESGRQELLGGTATGRFAPLGAALIVVFSANLLIALAAAFGLIGQGFPAAGSLALAFSGAAAGWMFAAVAALAAQVTSGSGAARGLSFLVFGAAYVLRAMGDADLLIGGPGLLSWLSPLGWVRFTRAFTGEQVWVFGLMLAWTVVFGAAAFFLLARRDLGAGLLPVSPGRTRAAPSFNSPLALSWRLNRSSLIAWMAGATLTGALLGGTAATFSKFVDAPQLQEWVRRMGAQDAGEAYLFILIYVLGQVCAAYAISLALRLRSEETEGRADLLLSNRVSRTRWAASHLIFAVAAPALLLTILGFFIGLGFGLSAGDVAHVLPRLMLRTLATLPAVWVMAGIVAILIGWLPRLSAAASWGLLGVFFLLELGWELQQIPQSVFDLSPFAYVHWSIPLSTEPWIWLTLAAGLLTAVGLAGLRKRDVI